MIAVTINFSIGWSFFWLIPAFACLLTALSFVYAIGKDVRAKDKTKKSKVSAVAADMLIASIFLAANWACVLQT